MESTTGSQHSSTGTGKRKRNQQRPQQSQRQDAQPRKIRCNGDEEVDVSTIVAHNPGPEATYVMYLSLYCIVEDLNMREKRDLFRRMRESEGLDDPFFPSHGMSADEFTVFYVLTDKVRKGSQQV
jgi:hypothetical protein